MVGQSLCVLRVRKKRNRLRPVSERAGQTKCTRVTRRTQDLFSLLISAFGGKRTSGEQAADQGGFGDAADGEDVGSGARVHVKLAHRFVDVVEGALHTNSSLALTSCVCQKKPCKSCAHSK